MVVDEKVLAELPPQLQEEIRREMRLTKRPGAALPATDVAAKRCRPEVVEIDA
ncbi:unnamed protein product [Symbiodinium natans]|uniref:Uncharacterized protein n=1 Tax=Symbiodinium natans TaxID=878477 RepID=A0A812SMW1_9DINO|nr:unnamed protein product [Symbiodinium natans]